MKLNFLLFTLMMLIERLRSDNCMRITSKHMHGDSRLWISGYANCFEIPISSLKEIQVCISTVGYFSS